MNLICPNCQSQNVVKNGSYRNKQRFLCRTCEKQFSENYLDKKDYQVIQNRQALHLSLEGMSYRNIATTLKINHSTVYRHLQQFSELINEMQNSKTPEEKKLKELSYFIEDKSKTISYYPLLLLDLETGIAYVTKK